VTRGAPPGRVLRPLWYLGNNRVSQVGMMLTTGSAVTFITFFATELFGVSLGPYVGILAFVLLPAVFVLGLILIPIGIWYRRRGQIRRGRLPAEYPPVDFRRPEFRETLWFLVAMTGVNVVVFLTASYGAVHHMESVEFCGATCHTVMQPEYTAYQGAPHARVPCVSCHIGPGAPWFVRSKLSGSYQVLAVTFDLYPRPIPTPIENLRPSRETCEQCHWPEKFVGDKLLVKTHFSEDETAAETKTVLLMHIGGVDPLNGKPRGNHGVHVQPGAEIRYAATDHGRQQIPYVRYRRPNGEVVEYVATGEGAAPGPPPDDERLRRMDCMDCHNRPTHTFQLPGAAVDAALAADRIDRTLPYIKKQALERLQAAYPSPAEAISGIRSGLNDFYTARYPQIVHDRGPAIDAAAEVLAGIYARNVFPAMNVSWGTYANNLGHQDFPGCFRCHDGGHKSSDGREIPSGCDTCHALLALEDPDPEILKQLAGP
jgi:NapC/NirT cytochrome c family protein